MQPPHENRFTLLQARNCHDETILVHRLTPGAWARDFDAGTCLLHCRLVEDEEVDPGEEAVDEQLNATISEDGAEDGAADQVRMMHSVEKGASGEADARLTTAGEGTGGAEQQTAEQTSESNGD